MAKASSSRHFSTTGNVTTLRQSADQQRPYNAVSPPCTPPSQPPACLPRGRTGLKAARVRPSVRDAFEDRARDAFGAPQQRSQHGRNHSSQHDLSWSPRQVRDSVVDNMLLSLDQMGDAVDESTRPAVPIRPPFQGRYEHGDQEEEGQERPLGRPSYEQVRRHAPTSGRPRGHTYASSYSSGFSTPANAVPSPRSRGHRSNSSTGGLERVDGQRMTHRGTPQRAPRTAEQQQQRQQQQGSGPAMNALDDPSTPVRAAGIHRRGSSSPDIAQALDSAPWQRKVHRRSASFDHSLSHGPGKQTEAFLPPVGPTEGTFFYDESDAAPTPTVPHGPRNEQSPIVSSQLRPGSSIAASKTNVGRRSSMRGPFSLFGRGHKDHGSDLHVPRPSVPATNSRDLSDRDYDQLAPTSNPPALNPSNHCTPSNTNHHIAAAGKETQRPGFFRRVFGSRNTTPTYYDTPSAANRLHLPTTTNTPEAPGSRATNENRSFDATRTPTVQRAASREREPLKEQPAQNLNKKSSFFRRRRKSTTEPAPVPQLPPLAPRSHGEAPTQSRELGPPDTNNALSPTSSLRKVMNPYLENATPRNQDTKQRHFLADSSAAPLSRSSAQFNEVDRVTQHYECSSEAGISWYGPGPGGARTSQPPSVALAARRPSQDSGRPRASTDHSRTPSDIHKDLPALPRNLHASQDDSDGLFMRATPSRSTAKEAQFTAEEPQPKLRIRKRLSRSGAPQKPPVLPLNTATDVLTDPAKASDSTLSDYVSATSKIGSPVPDDGPKSPFDDGQTTKPTDQGGHVGDAKAELADPLKPLPDDEALAAKLLEGTADGISKDSTVSFLGGEGLKRARVCRAFAALFDFADTSILGALRLLCSKVALRGEAQQVDRVLEALAWRWCICNPNHGFQAADVVHTICYSLLLLNTDLHLANIEARMTRAQFVKNTMPNIRRIALEAAPDAFERGGRGSMLPPPRSPALAPADAHAAPKYGKNATEAADGPETIRPKPERQTSDGPESIRNLFIDTSTDDCGPLVKRPFQGKLSTWEGQVEAVLRNFYHSIRQERLPLHGSMPEADAPTESQPSSTSLASAAIRRTNSMLSKAGSETFPSRGRLLDGRGGLPSAGGGSSSRWSSKVRSRPRLYPPSAAHSRTSFDDGDAASAISPSGSSLWSSSRFSLGKTQTSMSAASFASDLSSGRGADYQQSIGFANALSQAIIREEAAGAGGGEGAEAKAEEPLRAVPLLEDESLELAGAPWAKEGLLKHKRHLDAADRRSKDRTWSDCFAVVEKGWMRLFQFPLDSGSRSLRHKTRTISGRHDISGSLAGSGAKSSGGPVVGGGNWLDNAKPLGQFPLRHTLASALPPPGYSRARPHVWALSLPTGAVHLFHAGTAEIVREFVAAANYWSARLSKEPLVGAVSNVEYGWSERIINLALLVGNSSGGTGDANRPPSTAPSIGGGSTAGGIVGGGAPPRPSIQSSIRSSFDHSVGGSGRPRLPGDRVPLGEWMPPSQSMLPSQLLEVDQLKALTNYVRNVEEELRKHNELRGAILLAFTPRHPNHAKALANWERKSSYLLREIVKFSTYADCLQSAQTAKEQVCADRKERERRKELEVTNTSVKVESGTEEISA